MFENSVVHDDFYACIDFTTLEQIWRETDHELKKLLKLKETRNYAKPVTEDILNALIEQT